MTDWNEPGWDAECDHCDGRMSHTEDEGGEDRVGTRREAHDWGYWHKRDCEPTIRLLSPADLNQERESLERLRQRYPEMYGDGTPPVTTVPLPEENEDTDERHDEPADGKTA
jgi:hypothetical protein